MNLDNQLTGVVINAAIENALWRCQFGVKRGENRETLLDFDPKELVLSLQASKVCAKFRQNRIKSATERGWTHTNKHTNRDDTGDLIICPMLCYSNGTDNNDKFRV